jgi:hypothetical protein
VKWIEDAKRENEELTWSGDEGMKTMATVRWLSNVPCFCFSFTSPLFSLLVSFFFFFALSYSLCSSFFVFFFLLVFRFSFSVFFFFLCPSPCVFSVSSSVFSLFFSWPFSVSSSRSLLPVFARSVLPLDSFFSFDFLCQLVLVPLCC